ncbi:DUF2806 domain-containing protein [Roseburia hominis]|uniref:DUF2806 domain-containing protein n=1 Tax=Roseburia hominis TaxID=301301 RepID=UPI001F215944|nr:DUF2806 domain-containing protein [Roseburia hominis]
MFDNLQVIPGEAFTAAGSLGEKLLDKVSNAIGLLVMPNNNKQYRSEAEKYLIEKIKNDEKMPELAKASCISNVRKLIKQYTNQCDIFADAMKLLDEKSDLDKVDDVDDDWLEYFFDKAKAIGKEDMKIIWSKLLAKEIQNPNSVSRQLLHILTVINQDEAKSFSKLSSYCIKIDKREMVIIFYDILHKNSIENVIKDGELFRLEDIGLIQVSPIGYNYHVKNEQEVMYFDKHIDISEVKEIKVGNVILSRAGEELMSILTDRKPIVGFEDVLSKKLIGEKL